jgi:copper chaperone CopZ
MSYYLHHVPGRLRVRSPLIKGNEQRASHVQRLLRLIHGIQSTSVNTVTGSVVIHYDRRVVDPETITGALTQAGYFDQSKAITNDQYIHNAASTAGQWAWKALFGAFADVAMQGSPLSLITLLI